MGWTPNPGTALYVGYNDDLNRNGFNRFTGELEPGFCRNGRTFFVKMSLPDPEELRRLTPTSQNLLN